MADVPPVTIPTSVPAAFDDVASGGDDLATLLDRAGDILDRPGVPSGSFEGSSSQRATLNAFKGAPSVTVLHTAFADPTADPDEPPRESIDVRVLLSWD